MNGKGSTQRPKDDKYCSDEELEERWKRVFGKGYHGLSKSGVHVIDVSRPGKKGKFLSSS